MTRYEKKLKRSFFLFLGAFSLSLCLITFSVISVTLENQYEDFVQNHTALLQQNLIQKMSVFSQSVAFLASDAQLLYDIQSGNSDPANKKLQNFQQNSADIVTYAIFQSKNSTLSFLAGNRLTLPSENFYESGPDKDFAAGWYFFSSHKDYPVLYLYPLQQEQVRIGYLIFRIDLDNFMSSFSDQNNSYLWTAYTAIFSEQNQLLWCNDPAYWNTADISQLPQTDDFLKNGKFTLSSITLTEHGERFIQVLEKNIRELYRPLISGLLLIFLFSLFLIWFTVSRNIHKIISRLQRLQAKMSHLKK